MSGSDLFAAYDPRPRHAVWPGSVRLARPSDIETVAALSVTRDGGERAERAERLRRHIDAETSALHVGTIDDGVVGFGLIRELTFDEGSPPDGLYLGGVVIAEAWRRQGLAYALTAARLEWARERSDVVWYFANARNRASIALHDRFGFEEHTRDVRVPGVTFTGGEGVLFRLTL
ncbi:GNAT family N-acetyltransferase [Solicola gregarius]|uniref:GNAT family N-acetyltransferase n=1 Tax=Solicola gregarius TaxID=2908642 RepID=A0AA46TLK5_9ACTN|nr:GNAT family N-acetyltransferase [Solicola gregarius]UYM07516.1 GNAT family N-acetyltransferase [Solicola gregarius]